MTVEELKAELDLIPKDGTINKARRAAILRQIMELQQKEGEDKHD